MNDKTTLKIIKAIMEDKSIPDSEKLEAVKKMTDSCTTYVPYYPDQFPLTDPFPIFPWDGTPTYTSAGTDLEIETTPANLDTSGWFTHAWKDYQ